MFGQVSHDKYGPFEVLENLIFCSMVFRIPSLDPAFGLFWVQPSTSEDNTEWTPPLLPVYNLWPLWVHPKAWCSQRGRTWACIGCLLLRYTRGQRNIFFIIYYSFNSLYTQKLDKKFVWWWLCKPKYLILVFYFGPNSALCLGLRPSQTKIKFSHTSQGP